MTDGLFVGLSLHDYLTLRVPFFGLTGTSGLHLFLGLHIRFPFHGFAVILPFFVAITFAFP
jgi:hypothetical protein